MKLTKFIAAAVLGLSAWIIALPAQAMPAGQLSSGAVSKGLTGVVIDVHRRSYRHTHRRYHCHGRRCHSHRHSRRHSHKIRRKYRRRVFTHRHCHGRYFCHRHRHTRRHRH
ncbi:MAG: hypothetical protein AAF764_03295 [Pseudomonadota bacterium]